MTINKELNIEVLNTNDQNTINEFKKNLAFLIQEAKQKGQIDRFALIREDDYLPVNWQWQSNSMFTQMEYSFCFLSSAILNELCLEHIRKKRAEQPTTTSTEKKSILNFFSKRRKDYQESPIIEIPILPSQKEYDLALKEIDKSLCKIYIPSRYRLSKHYTINTPLSHTGDYNFVPVDRNFIIIDDAEFFFESPYAFTASYRDSYLDTTHEPLNISEKAIVLIPREKFEILIKDPKIAQLLKERKTIVFEGDEGLAVNIVLARQGYLPARFGYQYAEYDSTLSDIMETSLKKKCEEKKVPYNIPHNNHFSMQFSDENTEFTVQNKEFYEFLKNKFPEYSDSIPTNPLVDNEINRRYATRLIQKIGLKPLINALQEYNQIEHQKFEERNRQYLLQQKNLTPKELEYFRKVALLIKRTLAMSENNKTMDPVFAEHLRRFYEVGNFDTQFIAAQKLEETLENHSSKKIDKSEKEKRR